MKKADFIKGISVVEIMITLAILTAISFVVIFSFSDLNKKQILDKSIENALSILGESRSLAMSSQGFSDYGVRFSSTSIISFSGNDFNSGIDKKEYFIDDLVLFDYVLSTGSSDIIFKKVTGETDQSGTLNFSLNTDSTKVKYIEIYNTGVLEIK